MKEFTIIIGGGGKAEISLKGFETESPKIAKEFEEALGGKPEKVNWSPKQHLGNTVKHGR